MMSTHNRVRRLRRGLDRIAVLFHEKRRYPEIVKVTRRLLSEFPGVVPLLVYKAMAIQQLDEEAAGRLATLGEAFDALSLAVELDPQSVDALTELGFYLYAIQNDANRALDVFERGIRIGAQSLREAYVGRVKCLLELRRRSAAARALSEATRLFPRDKAIRELKRVARLDHN